MNPCKVSPPGLAREGKWREGAYNRGTVCLLTLKCSSTPIEGDWKWLGKEVDELSTLITICSPPSSTYGCLPKTCVYTFSVLQKLYMAYYRIRSIRRAATSSENSITPRQ